VFRPPNSKPSPGTGPGLIDTSGMFVEIEDQKDLDSMVQAAFQSGKALKVESVLTHGGTVRS